MVALDALGGAITDGARAVAGRRHRAYARAIAQTMIWSAPSR
jgi:hypothetical protein